MSSNVGDNTPPAVFWDGLREIVGDRALESYDQTQFSQRDVKRLVKGIGAKPEAVRLEMARYILENCSLDSGMFQNLTGLIGWVSPDDEPALIEAIASHPHFHEDYAYDIFARSGWMENEKLKVAIEDLGMDLTTDQLLTTVRAVIESQSRGLFFD